eukprot:1142777-Pelagomonas_calceolata.AAC.4
MPPKPLAAKLTFKICARYNGVVEVAAVQICIPEINPIYHSIGEVHVAEVCAGSKGSACVMRRYIQKYWQLIWGNKNATASLLEPGTTYNCLYILRRGKVRRVQGLVSWQEGVNFGLAPLPPYSAPTP